MKEVFKKGKLTIPFLNNALETIDQYSDTYLPSHQMSIQMLRRAIIPKVEEFMKCERQFTHVNKIILVLNAWIFIGFIFGTISAGLVFYFTIGLLGTINLDLITQQIKLAHAKYYMKRACSNYTKYMQQREQSKEAIGEFLHTVDKLVDSMPLDDKNNKNEEKPNGRSD